MLIYFAEGIPTVISTKGNSRHTFFFVLGANKIIAFNYYSDCTKTMAYSKIPEEKFRQAK